MSETIQDAAIIGAGAAGAACARVLRDAGLTPAVYDEARGPGGRLSTRRADSPLGEIRIDHGAQFVTAESRSFSALLEEAREQGAAAIWDARLVSIDHGANSASLSEKTRWVGVPGMSAVIKTALARIEVRYGRQALRVRGGPGAWTLDFQDGAEEGPFARVALTMPPEQLVEFLARSQGDFSDLIVQARDCEVAPCWSVMTVHDAPFDPGFDGARLLGGALSWISRTNSRPGRPGPESWVLQASPDWSRAFLETDEARVVRDLAEEAYVRFGLARPVWAQAHRWRYARVETPAGSPAGLDASATLGCAGDWRLGARAEAAWESGEALGRILANS